MLPRISLASEGLAYAVGSAQDVSNPVHSIDSHMPLLPLNRAEGSGSVCCRPGAASSSNLNGDGKTDLITGHVGTVVGADGIAVLLNTTL
ncbi:hypothetical protein [Nocardia transvalensis]|uniref:hypothetical protein n=1 Tax=Nocardia transvalensis TaxID=37333 RepID=UPI001895824C|nr:hypothetical protein [Nocardia transvalensis]MBF6332144.1 hypothetical protein [Nocardia transvalensis]